VAPATGWRDDPWQQVDGLTRLARSDLRIEEKNAFAALTPLMGDRLPVEHRPAPEATTCTIKPLSGLD
jgi:hypothetical protein